MSILRLPFQALSLAVLLTACAAAPTVINPRHDPANAAGPESPMPQSSSSWVEDAPRVDLAEPTASDPAPGDGMKNGVGMKGMSSSPASSPVAPGKTIYTCPMHPEVQQDHPGQCPKCGMTLVPQKNGSHS